MVKELISKALTILFVLFALHGVAGSVEPANDKKVSSDESTVVVETDSTETESDQNSKLGKITDKVSENTAKLKDEDVSESSSASSSIVSFNFVYYLLEKFKFSDLLAR